MGHIIVSLVNITKLESSHMFNTDYYQK